MAPFIWLTPLYSGMNGLPLSKITFSITVICFVCAHTLSIPAGEETFVILYSIHLSSDSKLLNEM